MNMASRKTLWLVLAILGVMHAVILCAGFFSPHDPAAQHRLVPFASPARLRWVDAQGQFHLRPFVYARVPDPANPRALVEDRTRLFPLRFFVESWEYRVAGAFSSRLHLVGAEEPAQLFLLGTDDYGRDVFSRLLHGGQISLLAGLLAAGLSLALGATLGTLAGFFGRWADAGIMRLAELFLSLPWVYLLLAVRAFLPLHISPSEAFLLITVVVGMIGWARPARLVRGVVLSAKERTFVLAARGFGASNLYLLRRHVLPETYGVLLTQASLLIPQYILAEVTLSFLGLGVGEPAASWGNMLSSLQQYHVLTSYWWMFAPGAVLFLFGLGFFLLASALQERASAAA